MGIQVVLTSLPQHTDSDPRDGVADRSTVSFLPARSAGIPGKMALSEQCELLHRLQECSVALFHYKKIDVKQLARLMHMSRPTLYRKLKGITGLTPNEWINEVKMKRAAQLLAEGTYRASQVARLLGYPSQSSFGKMFLKQFKVAPATYQRMEFMSGQSYASSTDATPAP